MTSYCVVYKNFQKQVKINHHPGFTLIELLVVIAIIGVLASVVLASLNSAREKSRDTARIAQLREIEKALDTYFVEYGYYPREGVSGEDTGSGEICRSCSGEINSVLDAYMGGVPEDPAHNSNNNTNYNSGEYYYYYDGRHLCGGELKAVVYAIDMENDALSNEAATCGSFGGEGGINSSGANGYVIILGDGS